MRFVHMASIGLAALAAPAAAQNIYDPAVRITAQREAMARLSILDGVWRGSAWTATPQGRHEIVQTERIGGFLGNSIKVVEGRGYAADGRVVFNAFGVIAYDPESRSYNMTSWAMGYVGTFPLRMTDSGYVWERPDRPGTTIRYTAMIAGNSFREVGEEIVGGSAPVQIFEMNLRRVGATDWPAGNPVPIR